MPQFLLLIAAGAGIYFGAKALKRRLNGLGEQVKATQEAMKEAAKERVKPDDGGMRELGDLEFDEGTQTYKPKD